MTTDPIQAETAPLDLRLLPGALLCWAVTICGILVGWRIASWLSVAMVAAAAVVFGLRALGHLVEAVAFAVLATVLLGAGFSAAIAWRAHAVAEHPLTRLPSGAYLSAGIQLTDDPKVLPGNNFGQQRVLVTANLRWSRSMAGASKAGGRVVLLAPAQGWSGLLPGQRVELRGSRQPSTRADLTVATVAVTGAPVRVEPAPRLQRFAGYVRARLATAAQRALPPDSAGLLPALVVGDTSRLPDQVREQFKVAGLTHLCAVSGANVSIFVGAVLLAARGLTIGPRTSTVLAALALALFVVLARPSPSVLRAAVMGAIGLLGLVTARRKQAVPALCTAIIVLLALRPELAVDFGFALSVLATFGLVLLAPSWADWLRERSVPRAIAETLAVASAAFVVTAPVIVVLSGTVSTVSIAANILVGFVVAPITVIGVLVAVLATLWLPAAVLVAHATGPPLWWLLRVADYAASLPGATVAIPGGPAAAPLIALAAVGLIVGLRVSVVRWTAAAVLLGVCAVAVPAWALMPR